MMTAETNSGRNTPGLRSLTASEDILLTRALGAWSEDELKQKRPLLHRVLSEAPEYFEDYVEYKTQETALPKGHAEEGTSEQKATSLRTIRRQSSVVAHDVGAVTWGLPLVMVFRLALQYLNAGTVRLPSADRTRLFALKRQAIKGPFSPEKMPDLGYFDFMGHAIKRAWEGLGDMDADTAMASFCKVLQDTDPQWKEFLLEEKRKIDEELHQEWERQEEERRREEEETRRQEEEERRRREEEEERQRREVEEAMARLALVQKQQEEEGKGKEEEEEFRRQQPEGRGSRSHEHEGEEEGEIDEDEAAYQRALQLEREFEQWLAVISQDPAAAFVVPRADSTIIRVPCDPDTVTWWEYATESYDVAFSVSLEHTTAAGATSVVPILPPLRTPCERRVVRGSHVSPHKGVYLLKFDNTYSYLRPKQVYLRCYATAV